MTVKKLRPVAPAGYIWCSDQWLPLGTCDACQKGKKCGTRKARMEQGVQEGEQDIQDNNN